MKPGEEILNLLDLNFYFFVKELENSKFDFDDVKSIEIALTFNDALDNTPLDMLSDMQYLPSKDIKVCPHCGTAKLVVIQDFKVMCSICNTKHNISELLLRNIYLSKKNQDV